MKKSRSSKAGKQNTRHRWTYEEQLEASTIFKKYIQAGKTPGQAVIEQGMKRSKEKGGHIWKLARDNIKKKTSWEICGVKEVKSSTF